jgi:methionyl-tRNA synthetase
MISIEEFQKIELRVAKILECTPIDGSEKLLKFKLSLGNEERQILSGIAKYYKPEDLIGKEIVIIANLEPRNIMGEVSQGMILAGSDENSLSVLFTDKELAPGSSIR